jgi:stage II sporulation protein D
MLANIVNTALKKIYISVFMGKIILFLLLLSIFACSPLRPLGPDKAPSTTPEEPQRKSEPEIEPEPETKEVEPEKKDERIDSVKSGIINVGIAFEKKSAKVQCPEKKWEFKAGAKKGKTEIESKGNCSYSGKTYRGSFAVLSTDSGLAVINTLDMEDYLKGVVVHEIGKLKIDGFEALKAQAVAARTYAYSHLGSRKSQGFDVYADTRDQVYNGKNDEDSLVNKAIEATSGIVIKHNGNLIEAYYHSTCGGNTETPETWMKEGKPYLVSVKDSAGGRAFCEVSRYTKWEEKFSKAELAKLFQKNASNARADKIFSFNKVEQIFIIEKFPSNRVKSLVVITDNGHFEVLGDRTRWLFQRNGKILPSSAFSIVNNKNDFTITGAGFGHGIGMCQIGAIERAKAGQSFDEILKAYYTGVTIEVY